MAASDVNVKLTIDATDFQQGVKAAGASLEKVEDQAEKMGKTTTKAMKDVGMSMRDMKKEVALLESSFKNLSGKELAAAQTASGKLRQEMLDLKKSMMVLGDDAIPTIVGGVRSLIGVAQTVTGSLAALGIETKGLDKAMMGLINVSMGMSQIWEMYEKKIVQANVALIKKTASTIKSTIAEKVMTAVTNGATIAQKALNIAVLAFPAAVIIAAIGTLAYAMVKMSEETEANQKKWEEWSDALRKSLKSLNEYSDDLVNALEGVNNKLKEFQDRNLTEDEKIKKSLTDKLWLQDKEISKVLELAKTERSRLELQKIILQAQIASFNGSLGEKQILQKELDLTIEREQRLAKTIIEGTEDQAKSRQKATNTVDDASESYKKYLLLIEAEKKAEEARRNALKKADDEAKKLLETQRKVREERQLAMEAAEKAFAPTREVDNSAKLKTKIDAEETEKQIKLINERAEAEINATKTEIEKLNELWATTAMTRDDYNEAYNAIKDAEIQTAIDNAEMLKKIDEDMWNAKIAKLKEYANLSNEILDGLSKISTNLAEIDANNFAAIRKEETESLEDEYKRRLQAAGNNAYQKKMVEEWYTTEAAKLNEDLAAKQEEIDRKNKIRNQVIAVGQATMDYAQGLVKIWAENASKVITIPVAVALSGLLTGVYATQLGVIKSQKFRDGGTDVLSGNPHEGGGIRFAPNKEAEGGERWAIFNKEATLRNTGLANLIDDINLHNLVIDKDFMSKIHGDSHNIVMVNNFKGGEHIKAIREYLENSKTGDKYLPDGRIQKGIIKRRYN